MALNVVDPLYAETLKRFIQDQFPEPYNTVRVYIDMAYHERWYYGENWSIKIKVFMKFSRINPWRRHHDHQWEMEVSGNTYDDACAKFKMFVQPQLRKVCWDIIKNDYYVRDPMR